MKTKLDKIANLAKRFGYTEILEKDFKKYIGKKEKGVKSLRVFANLEDLYKNTWVHIYESGGMAAVGYYYWSGPSGAWDSIESWEKVGTWKRMLED